MQKGQVNRNPYPGLRPFRSDEEHLFFGREEQVDRMIAKLAENRFLAVIGGSGSGKSSLVNCGLRPALHRGYMTEAGTKWRMAQFRPGTNPIGAMARALAKPGMLFDEALTGVLSGEELLDSTLRLGSLGLVQAVEQADLPEGTQVLIVADQFEELFRYEAQDVGQDYASEKTAFVRLLLEAAKQDDVPIHVVLTMRSDFLGDCTQFLGLPEAINEGQYLVPRLTRAQIRAAIANPAGVRGETISPVLVTRLLNDLGDNPDQLSILQHALNRTWAYWENELERKGYLSLECYEITGGMKKALNLHAEKAFKELPDDRSRQLCRRVFKALTDSSTEGRGTRRITPLAELCKITNASIEELHPILAIFRKPSRSFLMPPDGEPLGPDSDIDISHESLMRLWKRLADWTQEEAQSARSFCDLRKKSEDYAQGKAGLWRDPELSNALAWRKRNEPTPAWSARYGGGFASAMSFLDESRDEAIREKNTMRGKKRTRVTLGVATILAVVPIAILLLLQEFSRDFELAYAANILHEDLEYLAQTQEMNKLCGREDFADSDAFFVDFAAPLWAGDESIIEDLCIGKKTEHLEPEAIPVLIDFASHVSLGDIAGVELMMEEMPGVLTIPAYHLLRRVSEMNSDDIEAERECLTEMIGGSFDAPSTSETIEESCAQLDFTHPFHVPIFNALSEAVAKDLDKENKLLLIDVDQRFLLGQYGAGIFTWNDERISHSGVSWVYDAMAETAQHQSPLDSLFGLMEPYVGGLFIILAWPIWKLIRLRQRAKGGEIAEEPSSLRRAFAALFDFGVAIVLGMLTALVMSTILQLLDIYTNGDPEAFVALAIGTLYMLSCDALKFRCHRSIGKIAFDLRPANIVGDAPGDISWGISARRNIPKIIACVASFFFSFAAIESLYHYETWVLSFLPVVIVLFGLFVIVLIYSWMRKRSFAKIDPTSERYQRRRRAWAFLYCFAMGGLFSWTAYELMSVEADYLLASFAALTCLLLTGPYIVALIRGIPLYPTTVIDADAKRAATFDVPPRYVDKMADMLGMLTSQPSEATPGLKTRPLKT